MDEINMAFAEADVSVAPMFDYDDAVYFGSGPIRQCQTCRWWENESICKKISGADDYPAFIDWNIDSEDDLGFVDLWLKTEPNFGCNLWEHAPPDD